MQYLVLGLMLILMIGCQSTPVKVIKAPKPAPVVDYQSFPKPVITIGPRYPHVAAHSGQEGWVLLAFDVNAQGGVVNIKVLDSSPKGIFEKSAINALKKWKYIPPKVNGKYQPQAGLQTVIQFRLE